MRKIEAITAFDHSDDGIRSKHYPEGVYEVVAGPGDPKAGKVSEGAAKMACQEGYADELKPSPTKTAKTKAAATEVDDDPLEVDGGSEKRGLDGDDASSSAQDKAPKTKTSEPSENPSSSSTAPGDSDPTQKSSTPATGTGGAVKKGAKPPKPSKG